MVEIKLHNSDLKAKVDEVDLLFLSRYKWRWDGRYVVTSYNNSHLRMHNILLNAQFVDHKNNDTLDNRRENLRLSSNRLNQGNTFKTWKSTWSVYKGVTYHVRQGRWIAQIRTPNGRKWLGTFSTQQEAALAYNKAAIAVFGEHARLNKVV